MEVEAALALAVGLKAIGAGLAMLGAIGAGAGIGILVGGAVQGIARNPWYCIRRGCCYLCSCCGPYYSICSLILRDIGTNERILPIKE